MGKSTRAEMRRRKKREAKNKVKLERVRHQKEASELREFRNDKNKMIEDAKRVISDMRTVSNTIDNMPESIRKELETTEEWPKLQNLVTVGLGTLEVALEEFQEINPQDPVELLSASSELMEALQAYSAVLQLLSDPEDKRFEELMYEGITGKKLLPTEEEVTKTITEPEIES